MRRRSPIADAIDLPTTVAIYVALLFVPLAIARPRAGPAWFLAYALWPILAIDGRVLRAWMFLLLAVAVMAVPLFSRRGTSPTTSP